AAQAPPRRRGVHGIGWAAAAALVLAVIGPLVWRHAVDQGPVAPRDGSAPPSGAPPETAAGGAMTPGEASHPTAVPPAPAIVSLSLDARASRALGGPGPPGVALAPETTELRLRVACGDADYPSYRIVLRTAAGAGVLARDHVRPQRTAGGPLVELGVPA